MASYSQQYRFDVTANTQQAQTQLDKLQKSLQAVTTKKLTVVIDDSQLNEAAAAAQLLQQQLTLATNAKTGKLDLTAFNNSLQQAGTNIGQLSAKLLSAGDEGRAAFTNLSNAIAMTEAPVKELSKGLSAIGTTLINTIKWQAASSLIHSMMATFSGAVTYAKNLNNTLNDIRIVTGASSDEMAVFAENANRAAKQLSTTTGEFAKASLIYYQQGDNAAEAAQKAAITTKAANIAFTASAQEMSQMLTAVWNSYKMGGDELERAVDVMAKLGATTATSMEEISTGMQKVAATANVVGVSMEQMSAMIATSSSVTRQSAEIVGTSWNTILSRFTSLKLGETLEDGVDLTKYTKALASIGVQALDVSGNLRNAGNIIDEIGQKWQMMNEAQKSAFAQTVGGVRQYTQIMAFFENFDKYQANLKTAQSAEGELNKQQEIYAESWEAASKRARAALEDLYDQLIDDKAITTITNLFTTLVNGITTITKSFGGAGNVIGLIATQLVEANIDKFSTKLAEIGTNLKNLFFDNSIEKYKETLSDMRTQLEALSKEGGLNEADLLGLKYDQQILTMKEKLAQSQDHLTATQKANAESVIEQAQAFKKYYTQIMQMSEQAEQKIANVSKNIQDNFEQQAVALLQKEGYIGRDYKSIAEATMQTRTMGLDELLLPKNETGLSKGLDNFIQQVKDLADAYNILENQPLTMEKVRTTIEEVARDFGTLEKSMAQAQSRLGENWNIETGMFSNIEERVQYIESLFKALKESPTAQNENIAEQIKVINEELDKLRQNGEPTMDQLKNLTELLHGAFYNTVQTAKDNIDNFVESLKGTPFESFIPGFQELIALARKLGFQFGKSGEDAENMQKKLQGAFDQVTKSANTSIQTFTSIASAASRTVMAFNSIKNAYDTIKNPDVSNLQKVSTILSTLVTVGFALSSVTKLLNIAFIKNTAEAWRDGLAHLFLAGAEATATQNAILLKLALLGIIGVIAAVVAGITAFIIHVANMETATEKWQKEQEKLKKSIEEVKEEHEELGNTLADLSAIMNDTTLTYQDQLSKINEIIKVYGIQADAVDVLTGKYGDLLNKLQDVEKAQAINNWEKATEQVKKAEEQIDAYFTNLREQIYQNTSQSILQWFNPLLGVLNGLQMIQNAQGTQGVIGNFNENRDINTASLFRSSAWDQYGKNDGNTKGIWSSYDKDKYYSKEGELWKTNNEFADALYEAGYQMLDGILTTSSNYVRKTSEEALYKLLTNRGDQKFEELNNLSSDSYTAKLIQALDDNIGYEALYEAKDLQKTTELVNKLFQNNFDIARIKEGEASVKEIQQIIENIAGSESAKQQSNLLDYIGQFDQYKTAATQLKGIQEMAKNISIISGKDNQQIVQKELEKVLANTEYPIDIVLKLSPTDVYFDETKKEWVIDKAAVEYAEAVMAAEKAAEKLTLLQDDKNTKAVESSTIDQKDYQQLNESSIFENQQALQDFVLKSVGERKALWAKMIQDTTNDQAIAIEAEAAAAQQRLKDLENSKTEWLKTVDEQELRQIDDKRSNLYGDIANSQKLIDKYKELNAEQQKTFAKDNGLNENWSISDEEKNLNRLNDQLEQYNKQLIQWDGYNNQILNVQQEIVDVNKQLEASKYWQTVGSKIETATNNAEKFAAAIGQKGKMSEDDLAWLNIMGDPNNVLEKYAQSSEEWNRYAYNQAKKYYAELYELREGDIIAQQAVKQKMIDLDTNYYKTLEDKAEAAAQVIQDKWDKQIKAQDNVLNLISSNLTKLDELDFKNMDALRDNLKDAKVDAEQIERIIKNISEADTDEERIKAGMVAATEAALAKLSTLGQQKQDYIGIVTTLDTSKVDNTSIPVQADLGTEEAENKLDDLNNKEFNPKGTAILDGQQVDDTIEGWKEAIANNSYVIDTVEGEPVAKAIKNWKANTTNQTYTITLDSGETITSTITGWQTALADDESNILKFTVQNGDGETQTVERQIKDWIPDDETVQIKVADGMGESTIESTITSWIVGTDESGQRYVQVGLDNGSTLQTDITDITTQDRDIVVELSDGTKKSLPADIGALVNPETGFKTKLTADGDLQKQIDDFKLHANVAVSFDMSNLEYDNAFTSMDDYIKKAFGNVDHIQIAQQLEGDINEALSTIKVDWTGNWNAQQAGFMTALVNTVRTMPKDEINKLSKDYVGQIVAKLAETMQSKSKATRQLAEFLWAGLKKGLQDSYTKENWQEALQSVGLDEDMYSAFAKILQIESPSKLTEGLAYWLFAGLSKGLKDGDKNFIIDPLTNVRDQLEKKAKEAIEGAGISKIIAEEYEKAIAAAKKLNQLSGYIDLGLDKEIAQSLVNANSDFYTAAENAGQAAIDDAKAQRDRMRQSSGRIKYTKMTDEEIEYYLDTVLPETADLEKVYNNAIQAYIDNLFKQLDKGTGEQFSKEYISGKKWNDDSSMSDTKKAILNGAFNAAMKELNFTNEDLTDSEKLDELVKLVQKNLNEDLDKLEVNIEEVWNEVQSVWANGLEALYKNETEIAEKTLKLWKDTFNAIKDARTGLAEGKSILETMYNDPEGMGKIIQNWVKQGFDFNEIQNMLRDSNLKIPLNFEAWDAEAYDKSGKQRFLEKDESGNYLPTTEKQFRENVNEYVVKELGQKLKDVINDTTKLDKLKTSTDKNDQALVEILKNAGFMNQKGNLDLSGAKIEEVYEAVVNGIIDGMNQSDIDSLLGEAYTAQIAAKANLAYGARGEAENQVDIWQDAKDKIDTAIQTLLDENSLDSMTATDKDSLVTVLKDMGFLEEGADASALSLETLQNASNTLAERMVTLAEQIGRAMQMIFNGEADSWQINKEGNVEVFKETSVKDAIDQGYANDPNKVNQELVQNMIEQAEQAAQKAVQDAANDDQGLAGRAATAHKSVEKIEQEIYDQAYEKALEEAKVPVKTTLGNSSVSSKERGEKLNAAGNAVTDQDILRMKQYAQACNTADKEFQTLVFSLGKNIKSMSDFVNLSDKEQKQLLELARDIKKASSGWEGLQKAQKESFNILKKGQKDTYEYFETLNSVTQNVKAIFAGAKVVTKEFVEAHLADIEKMANGDMDAAERIEAAVLEAQSVLDGWDFNAEIKFDVDKDGVEDDLGTIGELLNNFGDEFANQEVGFTITADEEPAIEILNHLLAIGALTKDQMNAIFEEIGWIPEISYQDVTVDQAQKMGVTGDVTIVMPDGTTRVGSINGEEAATAGALIRVPVIKSAKKSGTGVRSMPSTQRPRPTRTRTTRPTRQPREREEKPKEVREDDAASRQSEAKDKADIERYHQVNKQLEQQTMMLERINKLKSARYGGDYLKALRQENEELRRQAKIQEEKYEEAQKYLAFDKKRLEQINQSVVRWWSQDGQKELSSTISGLGLANMQVLYDEEGNIDYQNLMEQATDRYNELREKFMADPEVWGDAFKAYSDWYSSELPKMISSYEESLQNVQQYVNQILDAMNQLSANNAEIIKYKVQLVIEEIEFDKSWEDYVQKAWSDDIEHVADILQSQFNKIFGKNRFDAEGKATGGVLKAIDTYIKELDDANKALETYQKNKDKIDNFAATGMNADEIAEMLGEEFINEADYATLVKEIRTNLLTELNNLEEYKQALETSYTNLLSLAEAEWQKYESIVSNNITIVDTFKEIAKLTGEAYRNDKEYKDWSKRMTDTQIAAYDQMIDESMRQYAVHQAQLDELMRKANGDLNNLTEEERKQYDQTLAKAQAAEQKKLEYVQKKLAALRTEYEESVDYILKRLQTAMLQGTGALSFEDLASDYEWYNEQQDRYLSSTKELYEVSKLNRSINQSIEDTTNQATKERLRALQSVIDKQTQLNKLTQYDVDQMNLQYQLALALDELENARMNKSVVRLTRDEYGNMGYQYTADEDELNSAQQKYEDVLQQINDLAEKRVQELENSYIQTMNDYYSQAKQIALEYSDDEETRNQKLQELAERTKNRLQFLSEQMTIANTNLIRSNTAIFEYYDEQTKKYVGTPESTSGINHTIDQLSSQWQKHQILIDQSVTDIVKEMQTYHDKAAETAEKTGTSMSKMTEELEKVTEQNNIAAVSMGEVTDALADQYDQLNEATDAWKTWSEAVEDAVDAAQSAIEGIGETLAEMGIDDASALWGSRGYDGTGSGTGSSTQSGSSGGNIGGGGKGKVDTVKYSLKDLEKDGIDGIPVRDGIKDGGLIDTKRAGDVITFDRMSGSYVWSRSLKGWINIAYLDKEMSDSSKYSTTAELLSTAIAQYRIKNYDELKEYKTGGSIDFTGPAWVDGTPSSPEYILNARQTDQMFDAIEAVSNLDIDFVRDVFDTINMMTASTMSGLGGYISPSAFNSVATNDSHNIEQHIEINAQFPDASDYTEIKSVFDTLVNTATQYAYRGQN